MENLCPRCWLGIFFRIGAVEVCPSCGLAISAEEGSARHGQLPERLGTCSRCRGEVVVAGHAEACWYCLGDLCAACWEDYGHCGHPEAEEANRRARAWKPGDPLLPSPWALAG